MSMGFVEMLSYLCGICFFLCGFLSLLLQLLFSSGVKSSEWEVDPTWLYCGKREVGVEVFDPPDEIYVIFIFPMQINAGVGYL